MAASLVLTVVGPDRPGVVDEVASLVAGHGGNWLESRMSRLGGQFAGILRAEVPESSQRAFLEAAKGLRAKGVTVVAVEDTSGAPGVVGRGWVISIVGQDQPGIVRQISHALASRGVNVEDLQTECVSAPMSGESLFRARALVQVPASCDEAELRRDLERIAADLIVDVALREAEGEG